MTIVALILFLTWCRVTHARRGSGGLVFAGDDVLDLVNGRGAGGQVVGHDLAPAHDDDAVDDLEDVMDVVRDEDAGCPLSRASRTNFRTPCVSATPRLFVGSSRMIRSLSKYIARAMATACRSPPDRAEMGVVAGCSW